MQAFLLIQLAFVSRLGSRPSVLDSYQMQMRSTYRLRLLPLR